jgi:hypothetical protein
MFSDGTTPTREVCLTTSSIAHAVSPTAATLIEIREGMQAGPKSWLVVQVDGATETRPNMVAYYIAPVDQSSSFARLCSSSPCGEIEVTASKVFEGGRTIALRGLKLSSGEGGSDITLTGTLEAR